MATVVPYQEQEAVASRPPLFLAGNLEIAIAAKLCTTGQGN
jgi:hypothetical protein